PDGLLVGFVIDGDRFDLIGVEGAGRDGDAFGGDYFQLPDFQLLSLNVKVAKRSYIPGGQWQAREHVERAAAVGENHPADIGRNWFRLAIHGHRAGGPVVLEIKFDHDSPLIDRTML